MGDAVNPDVATASAYLVDPIRNQAGKVKEEGGEDEPETGEGDDFKFHRFHLLPSPVSADAS